MNGNDLSGWKVSIYWKNSISFFHQLTEICKSSQYTKMSYRISDFSFTIMVNNYLHVLLRSIIFARADWSRLHHWSLDLWSLAYGCLAIFAKASKTTLVRIGVLFVVCMEWVLLPHSLKTPVSRYSMVGSIATPPTKVIQHSKQW